MIWHPAAEPACIETIKQTTQKQTEEATTQHYSDICEKAVPFYCTHSHLHMLFCNYHNYVTDTACDRYFMMILIKYMVQSFTKFDDNLKY